MSGPSKSAPRRPNRVLQHKQYVGSLRPNLTSGRLEGDLKLGGKRVLYSGRTVAEAKASFVKAVDTYLADCRRTGTVPETPAKKQLLVRMPGPLHAKLRARADRDGVSMNDVVNDALESHL